MTTRALYSTDTGNLVSVGTDLQNESAVSTITFAASWETSDTWPTTLPGLAN